MFKEQKPRMENLAGTSNLKKKRERAYLNRKKNVNLELNLQQPKLGMETDSFSSTLERAEGKINGLEYRSKKIPRMTHNGVKRQKMQRSKRHEHHNKKV